MVYNNIEDSPYKVEIGDYTFYFSSEFYKNNFSERYKAFLIDEKYKFQVKYDVSIDFDAIFLLYLYKGIEKRGFRVYYIGNRVTKDYFFKTMISPKSLNE